MGNARYIGRIGALAVALGIGAGLAATWCALGVGGDEYVPVYGGEAVHHERHVVGRLRSCAYGFTVKRNLAYSYLPVELRPGARVEVEVFGEMLPAIVTRDAVLAKDVRQHAS